MSKVPIMTLKNGIELPMIGLGTWRTAPEITTEVIRDALDVGYRHFDCAYIYGNEREVGAAIAEKLCEGELTREDLFITSKLWNTFHRPDLVRQGFDTSLKNLGLQYIDNYLLHWPIALKEESDDYPKDVNGKLIYSDEDYVNTWKAMEELVDAGLCRNIGLSNFNKNQIMRILSVARIKPTILQIECHPYLNQQRLMKYCAQQDIAITAYSALGSGHTPYEKPGEYKLMDDPIIRDIASEHSKNPAQVLVRYQIQRGNSVVVRSISKSHMEANLEIDFELTPQNMEAMNELDMNGRIMTMVAAAGHPHHPFEHDEY